MQFILSIWTPIITLTPFKHTLYLPMPSYQLRNVFFSYSFSFLRKSSLCYAISIESGTCPGEWTARQRHIAKEHRLSLFKLYDSSSLSDSGGIWAYHSSPCWDFCLTGACVHLEQLLWLLCIHVYTALMYPETLVYWCKAITSGS